MPVRRTFPPVRGLLRLSGLSEGLLRRSGGRALTEDNKIFMDHNDQTERKSENERRTSEDRQVCAG